MYRILYVDDDPELLRITKLYLERTQEFTIDISVSAEDILDAGKVSQYDAIIADYQMPGLDGIAFLKEVRSRFGNVPFILFTGRGREEVVIEAINSGADFYLQKGGDPKAQFAELAHKLRQAIQRWQANEALKDSEQRLSDIVNFLPDATFAIDRSGHVMAWNHAIEAMTGVPAGEMLGKGDYEYAIPFYGTRRKILIDLIFEPDEVIARNYTNIIHEKDTLIADTTLPRPRGRQLVLMGKASPLYNRRGEITGSIESIRDITDLKRAAEEQRAGEEKYRLVVENSHDAIYIYKDNRFLFVNSRASELTGYTHDELMDRGIWDFIHPEDRARLQESGGRISGGQIPSVFSARILTKTGDIRYGEFFVDSIMYQGQPVLLGIIRDITDRGRAVDEIRAAYKQLLASSDELKARFEELTRTKERISESEERYRNVVEDQTEFISRFRPDGTHIFVNEAYCRYFNKKREEIIGKKFLPVIPKSDRHLVREHFASRTVESPVATVEHRIIMPDGSVRWQRWSDRAIFDKKGSLVEYQSVGRDITETKQMEEATRESESKYRNFFLTSRDCVFITSTDGRLLDMNEELAELLGYVDTDELRNASVTDLYANPDDRHEHTRVILAQGYSKDYPIDLKRKDGTIIHSLITTTVRRDRDGNVTGFQGTIRDITGQKSVDDELHSLNQFQSSIITNANVWLMVLDPDANIQIWNRAAEEISGYGEQEVKGNARVWKMLYPDKKYRKKVTKNIDRIIRENNYTEKVETVIRCKNGTEKIILWNTRSLPDDSGTITGYVSIGIDITKSVESADALRESERRFRTLLENIPDYVIVHRDGKLLYRNPAFEKGLGYTQKDFLAHFITFFIAPEYHEKIIEASKRRIKGEVVEPYEIDVITADGRRRTVSIRGAVIDYAGAPASLNVFTDITDQKNAKEVQQRLSEFQKSVITNARVWLSVLDNTGKILIWNRAAEEISGYRADEVVGKNEIWKIIYPEKEYRKEITDTINRIIREKTYIENFETTIRSKQGDEKVISWNTRGIPDATGTISDYITIGVDVTDRTLAEKALSQANAKLSLMSQITRHDILNQLTGLRGYNYLCRESLDNKKVLVDYLNRIDTAAATIQEQIGFTRDYQDMGVKAPVWQNLNKTIKKAVAALPMREVRVDVDCEDVKIFADKLFEKVFYNLIDNALRYGGTGLTTIRVHCKESETGMSVTCEDDGAGISLQDKKHLFTRGFGKHTGLGLFLTREILGITGITIMETSLPGKGARFELAVPKGRYRVSGSKKEREITAGS